MMEPLNSEQVTEALQQLDGWQVENGKLCADFEFDDFVGAFGFMARVALIAESANHHPNWSNVYSSVHIALSTHEADDSITELDVKLAGEINKLAT
ncbi:MAG: 4a-hydroxytetrahydrobiopterin dehydratase [Caldilineaceae bacterium]